MDSWASLACYPRRTFYPLSDGHCTQQLISDQPEPTIARLRYSLGGDRPSQTTRHAGSRTRIDGPRLDAREHKGGISRAPPPQLAPGLRWLPPILHMNSL